MMKLKFEMEDDFTKVKTMREVVLDADNLGDIIEEFRYFLIGVTYSDAQIDKALEKNINPEEYNGN